MNQYDFPRRGRTLRAWRLYKPTSPWVFFAAFAVALSPSLLCQRAVARTLSPQSLNETAIISRPLPPILNQSPTPTVAQPEWLLFAGQPVGQQLKQWGQEVGWRVIWQSQQDWLVPNNTTFHGSFTDVVSQVLQDLATEGAPIHGIFYQGNQTLIVTGDTQ